MNRNFEIEDLGRTYVRAKLGGKWGSHSLQELLDAGDEGREAFVKWFHDRIDDVAKNGVVDAEVGQKFAVNACRIIEFLGRPLVKLN